MAGVVWNEAFSVSNELLDSDHQILFNLLNQLHDAVDTGQSRDVVGSVVNVLAEYVEHHFRREEALLAQAGFPHLEAHQALHRRLEEKVCDIRDRWLGGERGALGEEVLDLLKKWLTDHILVSDKSYSAWVAGLGDAAVTAGRAAEGEGSTPS